MIQCEIILTGNELLLGKIVDTNGKWIIDQIVPYGIQVSRITTISDNLTVISSTIEGALERKPDYIFTSGGLGPTFDDMTVEGITLALTDSLVLEENSEAIEMMKRKYQERYPDFSFATLLQKRPYLLKMAKMPKDALPLSNSEGTAPGVLFPPLLTNGKTTIIAMPGIPKELHAIFTAHVLPDLIHASSNLHFYQGGFVFQNIGESKFTQIVYTLKDRYPDLWIKTHPRKSVAGQWELELHITSFQEEGDILDQMKAVYSLLKDHVLKTNGIISQETLPT